MMRKKTLLLLIWRKKTLLVFLLLLTRPTAEFAFRDDFGGFGVVEAEGGRSSEDVGEAAPHERPAHSPQPFVFGTSARHRGVALRHQSPPFFGERSALRLEFGAEVGGFGHRRVEFLSNDLRLVSFPRERPLQTFFARHDVSGAPLAEARQKKPRGLPSLDATGRVLQFVHRERHPQRLAQRRQLAKAHEAPVQPVHLPPRRDHARRKVII
mmetsp:Transcript_1353/g.3938  ORF Transcript_1353/g.3938 Transcript_1353/m.3938 type:complete len:211 (+) Transcript_1353:166-798(+)